MGIEPATFRFVAQCLNQTAHTIKPVSVHDCVLNPSLFMLRKSLLSSVQGHYFCLQLNFCTSYRKEFISRTPFLWRTISLVRKILEHVTHNFVIHLQRLKRPPKVTIKSTMELDFSSVRKKKANFLKRQLPGICNEISTRNIATDYNGQKYRFLL